MSLARRAFTLLELLVVIGVLVTVLALLLPALQRVRENMNRLRCANNLHQIGTALTLHHTDRGMWPNNGGWDGQQTIPAKSGGMVQITTTDLTMKGIVLHYGIGVPTASPSRQTGGWAYALLPYLGEKNVFEGVGWEQPMALYICPSRRSATAQPVANDAWGKYEGGGWSWGKIDYAANRYLFPNRPQTRSTVDLVGGVSYKVLVGEKAMHPDHYDTGTWYWDEPYFLGGTWSNCRFGLVVVRDRDTQMTSATLDFRNHWGSVHPRGAQFLYADTSVRSLRYRLPTDEIMISRLVPDAYTQPSLGEEE